MSFSLIRADAARRLMPRKLEDTLQAVDLTVRDMAAKGFDEVRLDSVVGWDLVQAYFGHGKTTDRELIHKVVRLLREAGYQVHERYEERQFVDMGLTLSWHADLSLADRIHDQPGTQP